MNERKVVISWIGVATVLAGFALLLATNGDRFAWTNQLAEIPAIELAVGSAMAGLTFISLACVIRSTIALKRGHSWQAIVLIVLVGIGLRVILLWSTPAFEDDFYRYLWDGAVTAQHINPYAFAPDEVFDDPAPEQLQDLAEQSSAIFERINHPHLKTIYPPVAQFWFGVAHTIGPWSLLSWRILGLAFELITLLLILDLLRQTGRSQLWSALYWWNPVVIKELTNSAHMEVVLLPMILAALALAVRRRYVLATIPLALAVGTKLWPIMLMPLLLRPLFNSPGRLIVALTIAGGLTIVWAVPPYLGGIDGSSGFVAFAKQWQTNSALFQNLNALAAMIGSMTGLVPEITGVIVRLFLAGIVGLIALWVSRQNYAGSQDLLERAAWVIGAQFLLSPVQFPWYATWVFILLPFVPISGLLAITVTIPLYYFSFHFAAQGRYDLFNAWVLWFIWIPVWVLLMRDGLRVWRQPLDWRADA